MVWTQIKFLVCEGVATLKDLLDYENGATVEQIVELVESASENKIATFKGQVTGMRMAIASVFGDSDILKKVFDDLDGAIGEAKSSLGRSKPAEDPEAKRKRDLKKTLGNLKKLEAFMNMPSGNQQ